MVLKFGGGEWVIGIYYFFWLGRKCIVNVLMKLMYMFVFRVVWMKEIVKLSMVCFYSIFICVW